MKKKAYRATSVKEIQISAVIPRLAEGPVWVGLDVGKGHTMVVIRDAQGDMLRPWKVNQPGEIGLIVERLRELSQHRPLVVAMEPTGTYGNPLRQALCDAGLAVHRVSPKAASDYAEVFDGVPSQHDGKDAAVVAELAAIGKSVPWPIGQAPYVELRCEVLWMNTQQDILQIWLGRLEALLSGHWPELTSLLHLNSATLLRILGEYGGPQPLAEDSEAAAKLADWGGTFLKREKIEAIVASAKSTAGVRMGEAERNFVQLCAREAQAAREKLQQSKSSLEKHAAENKDIQRVGQAVGMATACVLFATVGNPQDYSSGGAYRKALGLNLKERSSGKHQGRLKITKRGPSIARRWLYFAALRMIRQPAVKPWYARKKSKDQELGGKGVVAVMRKLALAIHAIAKGATFDPARLFPGKNYRPEEAGNPDSPPGALPPGPRNLAHGGQDRRTRSGSAGTGCAPAARPVSAAGTALGSVSTGALSSAQAGQS